MSLIPTSTERTDSSQAESDPAEASDLVDELVQPLVATFLAWWSLIAPICGMKRVPPRRPRDEVWPRDAHGRSGI